MASKPSFRDRAFVVRTYDFGEADRVVVLLTKEHGLVRAVAKGVRKTKSRFGSRVQPFVDIDVQLYPGRNLATITQADTVAYYGSGIIDDFDRYTSACAVMEAAEKLSYADEADEFLFDEVGSALKALQDTQFPTLVLDAFILRATAHSGWGLSLFNCAQCGRRGPHHAFHPAVGGAACLHCRPPGSFDVEEDTLHIMWLLTEGYFDAAQDKLTETTAAQVHRLSVAHLQFNVESAVSSLKIMEQA